LAFVVTRRQGRIADQWSVINIPLCVVLFVIVQRPRAPLRTDEKGSRSFLTSPTFSDASAD
jgi:hypothetical protein